jgi:hypothetical protein
MVVVIFDMVSLTNQFCGSKWCQVWFCYWNEILDTSRLGRAGEKLYEELLDITTLKVNAPRPTILKLTSCAEELQERPEPASRCDDLI